MHVKCLYSENILNNFVCVPIILIKNSNTFFLYFFVSIRLFNLNTFKKCFTQV